jgi:hypothetical protein
MRRRCRPDGLVASPEDADAVDEEPQPQLHPAMTAILTPGTGKKKSHARDSGGISAAVTKQAASAKNRL